MRTFQAWHIVAACFVAYAPALPAGAQQPAPETPPRLELLEEIVPVTSPGNKSEVTQQISEKRARGGKVTEVKVTNGNSTYYLKPSTGPSSSMGAAQWEILRFDMNSSSPEAEAVAEAERASAPLPPNAVETPPAK